MKIVPTKKGLKRCPKCNSTGIYKRMRAYDKKYRKTKIIKTIVKPYKCAKCKAEFDNPIIQ